MRSSPLTTVFLGLIVASFNFGPASARDASGIRYSEIPEGAYAVVAEVRAKPGKEREFRAHGAFVDGSGWLGVHRILREHGYPVVVVQHTTMSLAPSNARLQACAELNRQAR